MKLIKKITYNIIIMGIEKTLGGNRLGSGNKLKVELHNYERSTFNQSRKWLSTMNCGTLVPCFKEIGTNGDKFEIDIEAAIRTAPTLTPLFGSFKFQLDMFAVPIRLYNGLLHNNMANIGMQMDKVLFPTIDIPINRDTKIEFAKSSLMNYLGYRGAINNTFKYNESYFKANAIPLIAYYDIFKNYYANKQEEDAYIITQKKGKIVTSNIIQLIQNDGEVKKVYNIIPKQLPGSTEFYQTMLQKVATDGTLDSFLKGDWVEGEYSIVFAVRSEIGNESYKLSLYDVSQDIYLMIKGLTNNGFSESKNLYNGLEYKIEPNDLYKGIKDIDIVKALKKQVAEGLNKYYESSDSIKVLANYIKDISIEAFKLENIDNMRVKVLQNTGLNKCVNINVTSEMPYAANVMRFNNNDEVVENSEYNSYEQNGLCLKTFNSDIYNNWLSENYAANINYVNSVATATINNEGGKQTLSMDVLNMAQKVYNLLNRIAASGSSWQDWQEAVYAEDTIKRAETPIYLGGFSCDIAFQELISTAEVTDHKGNIVPQGNMVGKGISLNEKGGKIIVNCEEPLLIMGIASITPRCAYKNNSWHFNYLTNLDELHKPQLDGIGYQEASQGYKDYFANRVSEGGIFNGGSFKGYVPAWIHYMTAVDEVYGDFANEKLEVMSLTREYKVQKYDINKSFGINIQNDTTYINPNEFNYAFADNSLIAQNFWVQIGFNVESRRKMSAKLIPNL